MRKTDILVFEDWGTGTFFPPCGHTTGTGTGGQVDDPAWDWGMTLSWTCPRCGLRVEGFNLDAIGKCRIIWPDGEVTVNGMGQM